MGDAETRRISTNDLLKYLRFDKFLTNNRKTQNYVRIAEETIRISNEKGRLVDYLQKNREQVIEMTVNQMEEEERLAEFCRTKEKQGRERGNRKTARKKERKTA